MTARIKKFNTVNLAIFWSSMYKVMLSQIMYSIGNQNLENISSLFIKCLVSLYQNVWSITTYKCSHQFRVTYAIAYLYLMLTSISTTLSIFCLISGASSSYSLGLFLNWLFNLWKDFWKVAGCTVLPPYFSWGFSLVFKSCAALIVN